MTKAIYLVRHGRTLFNLLGKVQGISDTPLLPEGEQRAAALGRRFRQQNIQFDAVYTSDLARAVRTTQLLLAHSASPDQPVMMTRNLRETSFGMFEGDPDDAVWSTAGAASGNPELNGHCSDELRIEGLATLKKLDTTGFGESYEDVRKRIDRFFSRIAASDKSSILAVSHGMFINCVVYTFMKQRNQLPAIPNTTVTKLVFEDGKFDIAYVGKTVDL
jgi:Fructose-2,6-bisphosphatase